MTTEPIKEYFDALERLKRRREKINNDAVALEAGRKKGSIKKSRPQFDDLIIAIEMAAAEQARPRNEQLEKLNKVRNTADDLRAQLDAALGRELSLLAEVFELKKRLAKLTGDKVIPIRALGRRG